MAPVALSLALWAPSCLFAEYPDCIAGIEPGDDLVLTIIESYDEGSRFEYRPPVALPLPRICRDQPDIVTPTEVRLHVLRRVERTTSCHGFVAEAEVPTVTPFDPEMAVGGAIQANGQSDDGSCERGWMLMASTTNSRDVLGVAAVEGRMPPVIVERMLTGSCITGRVCEDFYAAELRRE